ncbi:hypothetical protein GGI24_000778 [Coemansia furcata]|nr:hypothetical protein GGI24_000778 [Coemansia furcata]
MFKRVLGRRTFQLLCVKFILPYGPEQPIPLNGRFHMPSWYDIKLLDRITSNEDKGGMNAWMMKINKDIKSEIDSGIPAGRIVLGGFSQGGAMTLFAGLQSKYCLGGLTVLSGYLPVRDCILKRAMDVSKSVPIFRAHGTADEVVLFQYGEMTSKALEESEYNVDLRLYNQMSHSSCDDERFHLQQFLKQRIPEKKKSAGRQTSP